MKMKKKFALMPIEKVMCKVDGENMLPTFGYVPAMCKIVAIKKNLLKNGEIAEEYSVVFDWTYENDNIFKNKAQYDSWGYCTNFEYAENVYDSFAECKKVADEKNKRLIEDKYPCNSALDKANKKKLAELQNNAMQKAIEMAGNNATLSM